MGLPAGRKAIEKHSLEMTPTTLVIVTYLQFPDQFRFSPTVS